VKWPSCNSCTILTVKAAVQRAERPSLTALIHLPLPYLATFGGFLISLLIAGVGLIGNEQGFLFRLTNRVSGEPVWAPEVAAGLLIGWVAYEHFPSRLAFLSFAVPPADRARTPCRSHCRPGKSRSRR
jgi:hypothetical protein